ncbi:MAG: alpha/beta fold hydrolase [Verrucomicrobiota bacterium]
MTVILTFAAAVAVAVLLAGPGAAAPPQPPPALSDRHPCPEIAGFTCSTLTVPLDRSGRVRGTLKLNVAGADNVGADRGVLLFLTGGPGQPGLPAVARIATRLGAVLPSYRLVMIDQRGTGATAIRCPALQAQVGTSDIAAPAPAAVRDCARRLSATRVFYSTRDTVADLDALRRALGVSTWTIDGVSYGTYVAERYALAHPKNVKALVLDSVLPHSDPQADDALYVTGLHATARVLRAACSAVQCGFDPADDIAWLVRHGVDGVKLFDLIVAYEFADPDYTAVLSEIHEARQGNPNPLLGLEANVRRAAGAPPQLFSAGLHAATLCADLRLPWSSSTPIVDRRALLARRLAQVPESALWPFTRATAAGNGLIRTCLPWPAAPPVPSPPHASRLPSVPVLLINGDRDLSTPLEWAREEARLAPRGRLVVVHGASHSVQSRERGNAGRAAVASFLLGPATA